MLVNTTDLSKQLENILCFINTRLAITSNKSCLEFKSSFCGYTYYVSFVFLWLYLLCLNPRSVVTLTMLVLYFIRW